jgi:hypothetical protein
MDDLIEKARALGLRSAELSQADPAKRNINSQYVKLIAEAGMAIKQAFIDGFNEGNQKNL